MTRRTVQAFRHIGFEDLGSFEAPLRAAGYEIDMTEVGGTRPAPALSADRLLHPPQEKLHQPFRRSV